MHACLGSQRCSPGHQASKRRHDGGNRSIQYHGMMLRNGHPLQWLSPAHGKRMMQENRCF